MTKAKNVQEYIAHQKTAIASNPECGTSHYNLAIGLLGLKKYEEAEKELLTAVECSPNLAEAYVQLGGICLQRGDMEGCLKYNKMAVWQCRQGQDFPKVMEILDLRNSNWEISKRRSRL